MINHRVLDLVFLPVLTVDLWIVSRVPTLLGLAIALAIAAMLLLGCDKSWTMLARKKVSFARGRKRSFGMEGVSQLEAWELMEARHWIDDCEWADLDNGEAYELSNRDVERGIEAFYDGGIESFKATVAALKPEVA